MRNYKKTSILLALCLAFTVLCAVCLIACNSLAPDIISFTPKATSYVSVDINPSIELVLDQHDEVMSVTGANEDARVLLFREDGIVGAKVSVAIENIASLAVDYGYLKEENSTIDLCVVSSSDDKQNKLFKSISDSFAKGVQEQNKSLSVSIANGISLSLGTELAKLKSQYSTDKNIQSLSVGNFKLVKRAMESDPSQNYEALAGKSTEELLSIASVLQNNADATYGDAYKKQVDKAKLVYNNTVQTLEGTFYVKHFVTNALDAYSNANYTEAKANLAKMSSAIKYTATNAYLLSLTYYQTRFASYLANPIYTVSQIVISEIADDLGVSTDEFKKAVDATPEKNSVKISKSALAFFVDKLYRNASEQERTRLASVYENICNKYLVTADKDEDDMQFSIDDVNKRILAIKTTLSTPQITLMLNLAGLDIDNILGQCKPENVDYDDYSDIDGEIASLNDFVQSAKNEMALTEEDEAKIKEEFSSAKSAFDDALQLFNKAKEKAVDDAIKYILSIKESRKDGSKNRV